MVRENWTMTNWLLHDKREWEFMTQGIRYVSWTRCWLSMDSLDTLQYDLA